MPRNTKIFTSVFNVPERIVHVGVTKDRFLVVLGSWLVNPLKLEAFEPQILVFQELTY